MSKIHQALFLIILFPRSLRPWLTCKIHKLQVLFKMAFIFKLTNLNQIVMLNSKPKNAYTK